MKKILKFFKKEPVAVVILSACLFFGIWAILEILGLW